MTDEIKAKFSLDDKEALQKLLSLKGTIESIGAAKNLAGLVSGLATVGAVLAPVVAAGLAMKAAFDVSLEAESIRSVGIQFELLGKNAGIATETLKAGLIEASKGLVDDTELLKVANKAIVTMGESAARLPEIMELARKASVVTGDDVADSFEKITHAIATGQAKALKQMGIIVDLNKAYQKYADSIGESVQVLSNEGKQRALLNEVLVQGKKNLSEVDETVLGTTKAWKEFKVSVSEIKDAIILLIDKAIGPFVREWAKALKTAAGSFKDFIVRDFGSGVEQLKAQNKHLISEIAKTEGEIARIKSLVAKGTFANEDTWIAKLEAKVIDLNKQLSDTQTKLKSAGAEKTEGGGRDDIDQKAKEERAAAFLRDLNALKQEALAENLLNINEANLKEFEAELMANEQIILMEEEFAARLAAIKAGPLNPTQQAEAAANLEILLEEKKKTAIINSQETIQAVILKSLENQSKAAETAFGRFSAGAALASKKAMNDFKNFGKFGESAVNSLSRNTVSAFSDMQFSVAGVAEAMKKALIGALADEAAARGALLIAGSIWPPNPVSLAAGVGLVALSGVLRGLAGGGGSPVAAGGGGAAGSIALKEEELNRRESLTKDKAELAKIESERELLAARKLEEEKKRILKNEELSTVEKLNRIAQLEKNFELEKQQFRQELKRQQDAIDREAENAARRAASLEDRPALDSHVAPRRSVNLTIQGNYFETEATRTRLVEIIRESGDITDFKITSVGGGL